VNRTNIYNDLSSGVECAHCDFVRHSHLELFLTERKWRRRDVVRLSAQTAGLLAASTLQTHGESARPDILSKSTKAQPATGRRRFNSSYESEFLSRVAFPMGGIGAGTICLEGYGGLSHVSIRNHPDLYNEPFMFSALTIMGTRPKAHLLQGPIPDYKITGLPYSGEGMMLHNYGLPRFQRASFETRFPFATVTLSDPDIPLGAKVTGWSPFVPGDADSSSLPVLALEYEFENHTAGTIEAVFSFNAFNFLGTDKELGFVDFVGRSIEGGFVIASSGMPGAEWQETSLAACVDSPTVKVNNCWLRDIWPLALAWSDIEAGVCRESASSIEKGSRGASLFVPLKVSAGGKASVVVRLAWYTPHSSLRYPPDPAPQTSRASDDTYRPWYSGRFPDIDQVVQYWKEHYLGLREKTLRFTNCFYDSTLPPEVIEAVAANLCILKSPTVLRQTDGRLWGWEGCDDDAGVCEGSCTHVWNYAQSLAHLFPNLERSLRETELGPSLSATGYQVYRSALPIRAINSEEPAAADGQLGGIMKTYREWRISGDIAWLRSLWPKVKLSLDYCIETWDPRHTGLLEEPHLNTCDYPFWGPDAMCNSIYLGALQAAIQMAVVVGDSHALYEKLLETGKARMEAQLFNGEYFQQIVRVEGLRASLPTMRDDGTPLPPDVRELVEREGPNWQIGTGCFSPGLVGVWLAKRCGLSSPLSLDKVRRHQKSVFEYNFKRDLSSLANPMRSTYALGHEGGLLMCTWPRGSMPVAPMVYSTEVWTGIEYQAASHLIELGLVDQGLQIVRTCRERYDGRVRNPFAEYECGYWYARAMSSYALLEALSGARFDAVERVLYLDPTIQGDFRCFLSTATGYGTVGIKDGKPFLEVVSGTIPYQRISYSGTHVT
jgi:uncharacterized protein (DUF608 family)